MNYLKYHLFCGDDIRPHYINVDKLNRKADLVMDVIDFARVTPENSAEEILMNHGIEHLPFEQAALLVQKSYKMLVKGGKLILVHPDALAAAQGLVDRTISPHKFEMLIWGYQSNPGEFHYSGFTPETMKDLLKSAGFKKVHISHKRRVYEMEVVATK